MANNVYVVGDAALTSLAERMTGGPGAGGPSGVEPRLAKLESSVDHIQSDIQEIKRDIRDLRNDAKTDFRLLFGAGLAATLGLAFLMAKGFHWL
jgi:hypothetical protein